LTPWSLLFKSSQARAMDDPRFWLTLCVASATGLIATGAEMNARRALAQKHGELAAELRNRVASLEEMRATVVKLESNIGSIGKDLARIDGTISTGSQQTYNAIKDLTKTVQELAVAVAKQERQ